MREDATVMRDEHRRALERLDRLIDPEHVMATEALHRDLYQGRPVDRIPCAIGFPVPADWPTYSFTECWDDLEKNFISALGDAYCGALIRDDRLYTVRPEYGVVNIPEIFGVPSVVTDEGRSMSKGLNDAEAVETLISRGVPDLDCPHTRKVDAWYQFAREALREYENLSRFVHPILPDTQGPFDLACLVYGSEVLTALYDRPETVRRLLDLVTEVYVRYSRRYKEVIGEPAGSAYHLAGLKLVRGGVRICDDSATLVSTATYRHLIKPCNLRAFEPFDGGWLHFCGNGNHILDEILDMPYVHYLHLGNPDDHELMDLIARTARKEVVLFWSGSLDMIREAFEIAGRSRLFVLTENRYASASVEKAREALALVRVGRPIAKAPY